MNNNTNNLDYAMMSKRQLMDAVSKDELMALVTKHGLRELCAKIPKRQARDTSLSRAELMDAYDRLKGKKKGRTQLEENGFVIACPHCQNHDLSKIYLVELVQEDRQIVKVEGGVIHYGEWLDSQHTGVHSGRCGECGLSFELPTKASTSGEVTGR